MGNEIVKQGQNVLERTHVLPENLTDEEARNLFLNVIQSNGGHLCGNETNSFIKEAAFMPNSGDRWGNCGTTKDAKRVYICDECWAKYIANN